MKNRLISANSRMPKTAENGYILPLVIITGVILVVGAVILSARSFSGLIRSSRQKQSDYAVEIAETGASILINELNSKFPYLLTVNCQVENNSASEQMQKPLCTGWQDFQFGQYGGAGSACPARSADPSQIMDLLYKPIKNERGSYRLRNYEFLGDQIQGGKAIIQVQGQRFRGAKHSSEIAASAIVEQEITIVPKCCGLSPYQQCNAGTGWNFGLATETIALGVGDILDEDPSISISGANVHCTDCDEPPSDKCDDWTKNGSKIQKIPVGKKTDCERGVDITEDMAGVIDGERSNGSIDIPAAPTWNTTLWGNPDPFTIGFDNYNPNRGFYAPTITHATVQGPHPDIPGCYTETTNSKKITHCRIKNISTSIPLNLEIKPGDGDIRFYVEGNQINLAGIYFIIPEEAKFGQFTIFGGASTWESAFEKFKSSGPGSKSFNWSGSGEINAFLYMPYFNINFSGGSCESPQVLRGAAITYGWNATGDCSQIRVPSNAGKTICDEYGLCSPASMETEFAALGSNRWSLIQMEQE